MSDHARLASTGALGAIAIGGAVITGWWLLGVIRSDERMRHRAVTWLLMPLAVVGSWTVLRVMRWWGVATCARTGWGTRQNGAEVRLTGATPELEAAPVPLALPAARSGSDTLEIPLVKLLDPDIENTLELAWPAR